MAERSVDESFVTDCRFLSDVRSAWDSDTVCGCAAVPWMFTTIALPAVICAPVTTPV